MHRRRAVVACPSVIYYAEDGEQESFVKHRLLGYGGFAAVYEVERVSDGCRMAAKVLPLSSLADSNKLRRVQNEIDINQLVHHPHVVTFLGSFQDEQNVYLLQELCCITLSELLKRVSRMSELQAAHILWQVLSALEHLHGCVVAHRDLKLSNMFLGCDGTVKVGDLGLACHLPSPTARRRSTCGSLNWMAPEVLRPGQAGYGLEVDIWALGVMLYTLLVGRPPFASSRADMGGGDAATAAAPPPTTCGRILQGYYRLPDPAEVPLGPRARDLIGRLLQVNPAARPSLAEVRAHPFFRAHLGPLVALHMRRRRPLSAGPGLPSAQRQQQQQEQLEWQQWQQQGGQCAGTCMGGRLESAATAAAGAEDDGESTGRVDSRALEPPAVSLVGAAPVAVDLRLLLGEAGLAAVAGGAGHSAERCSTSGSYMDLSQSEQCSVATTTTATTVCGGGGVAGASESRWASGAHDPLTSTPYSSYNPRRSRSSTLYPPQRLSEQITPPLLASGSQQLQPQEQQQLPREQRTRQGPSTSAKMLCPLRMPFSPGSVSPGGSVLFSPRSSLPSLGTAGSVLLSPGTLASSLGGFGAASGMNNGAIDGSGHSMHGDGVAFSPSAASAVASAGADCSAAPGAPTPAYRWQDLVTQLASVPGGGGRTVPGAGADQDLPLSGASVSIGRPVAMQRRGSTVGVVETLATTGSSGFAAGCSQALGAWGGAAGPVGNGEEAGRADAQFHSYGPSAMLRSSTAPTQASSLPSSSPSVSGRVSYLLASHAQALLHPHPHPQLQQQPVGRRRGRRATAESQVPTAETGQTDGGTGDGSTVRSGNGRDGGSAGTGWVGGLPAPALIRAAFLSHHPGGAGAALRQGSRRLLSTRSAHARHSALGTAAALMRSSSYIVAMGGGVGEEGEADSSDDTVRSYADSLEAMLMGADGRNAAAMKRQGPAPVAPLVAGSAPTAPALQLLYKPRTRSLLPGPAARAITASASIASIVPVVLRHGRSSTGTPSCRGISSAHSRPLAIPPGSPASAAMLPQLQSQGTVHLLVASAPCVHPASVSGPVPCRVTFADTTHELGLDSAVGATAGDESNSAARLLASLVSGTGPDDQSDGGEDANGVAATAALLATSTVSPTTPCDSGPLSLAVFALTPSKTGPARAAGSSSQHEMPTLQGAVRVLAAGEGEREQAIAGEPYSVDLAGAADEVSPGAHFFRTPPHLRPRSLDGDTGAPGGGKASSNQEQNHVGPADRDQQHQQRPAKGAASMPEPSADCQASEPFAGGKGAPLTALLAQQLQGLVRMEAQPPQPRKQRLGGFLQGTGLNKAWWLDGCGRSGPSAHVQGPARALGASQVRTAPAGVSGCCCACDSKSGGQHCVCAPGHCAPCHPLERVMDVKEGTGMQHQQAQDPGVSTGLGPSRCCVLQSQQQSQEQDPQRQQQSQASASGTGVTDPGPGAEPGGSARTHPWRAMALAQLRLQAEQLQRLREVEEDGGAVGPEPEGQRQRGPIPPHVQEAPLGTRRSCSTDSQVVLDQHRRPACPPAAASSEAGSGPGTGREGAWAGVAAGKAPPRGEAIGTVAADQKGLPWRASAVSAVRAAGSGAGATTSASGSASIGRGSSEASRGQGAVPGQGVAKTHEGAVSPVSQNVFVLGEPFPPAFPFSRTPSSSNHSPDRWGACCGLVGGPDSSPGLRNGGNAGCARRLRGPSPGAADAVVGTAARSLQASNDDPEDSWPWRVGAGAPSSFPPLRMRPSLEVQQVLRHLESRDGDNDELLAVPALTASFAYAGGGATAAAPRGADVAHFLSAEGMTGGKERCEASCNTPGAAAAAKVPASALAGVLAETPDPPASLPLLSVVNADHESPTRVESFVQQPVTRGAIRDVPANHCCPPAEQPRPPGAPGSVAGATRGEVPCCPGVQHGGEGTVRPWEEGTARPQPPAQPFAPARTGPAPAHSLQTPPSKPGPVVASGNGARHMPAPKVPASIPGAHPQPHSSPYDCLVPPALISSSVPGRLGSGSGTEEPCPSSPRLAASANGMAAAPVASLVPGASLTEALPGMDPEALAELASRLRSRSFMDNMASTTRNGSFTYRPSRMMPATRRSPSRRQALEAAAAAAAAVPVDTSGPAPACADASGTEAAAASGAACGDAGAGAQLRVAVPAAAPTEVSVRDVLMVKWLDYSAKYGLSYVLSNGAVGVLFRDGTQLVRDRGCAYAWLLGPMAGITAPGGGGGCTSARRGALLQPQPLPLHSQALLLPQEGDWGAEGVLEGGGGGGPRDPRHHDIVKKLKLLRSFQGMMLSVEGGGAEAKGAGEAPDGRVPPVAQAAATAETAAAPSRQQQVAPAPDVSAPPPAVFVTWWTRTQKALVLCLSSGTLQALFCDGSELVAREVDDEVDFLARDGRRSSCSLRAARLAGPKNSVTKRIQYATMLLHTRIGEHS